MKIRIAAVFAAIPLAVACASVPAATAVTKVRMTIDEDPIVIRLAQSLGYLRDEGIQIVPVDLEKLMGEDYLMQQPLVEGRIDVSYHWFNHTIFGARHGYPIEAVMVFNDAPGMTVMVANRVKGEVRDASAFAGRNVAQGAGYGTKAVITGYLAQQAGVKAGGYTPVMTAAEGRQEAVLAGLRGGSVDVMTFQEPLTSALRQTGLVSTLYDLNNGASTKKALGAAFPAQSLLVSPEYAKAHPQTVQHLVNALVRTMRFINSLDADAVLAKLPPEFYAGKDRAEAIAYVRATLPAYARGDYSISPASAELVTRVMRSSSFDSSEEGRWRGGGDDSKVDPAKLYDNRFVESAMQRIR
ncbi:MAG TPA: ABC transporter substrate-binding protein [Usitatibacter sp.]|jgi:NitT/TauT family transport system substrate-binding protein|nr:ABC transporter substrate-binding protein [Usitatibacter sp.]